MPRYKVNGKVYNLPEEKVEDFLIAYPEAVLLEEQEELGKASDVVVKDAAVTSSPEQASESTELEQVDISSELEDPKPTRVGRAQVRAKELEYRDKAIKEQDWFNNFASNVKSPRFSDLNQDQVLNIQNKAIEELTSKYKDEENEYSFDETDIRLKAASIFENKVLPKVSLEKDTNLEKFIKEKAPILNPYADFISDIYTAGVQGFSTSGLVDPTFELLKKGSGSSDEDIVKWIDANKKVAAENMQSDEMRDFNRIYKENGSGVFGFIKGIANNPSIMPSLLVSSVVTQFSSLRSEEVALAAAAGAGTGAIAGTIIPGAGTAAGAIGGAIGGGSAAMEASLTFSELLQEEIGEDLNLKAVKSLFEDEDKVADLKSKAIKRGIAIGLVEGLTGSIAKGVTGKVLKAGLKKPVATVAGVGVESIGGGLGEVAGRLAADQKMDVAEIGFEAVTGTTTAPITVGSELINLDNKIANYKINKELKNTDFNNIEQAFSPQSTTTEAQIKISQNKKAESILDTQLKKSVIKGDITQQQANDTKTNFLETQSAVSNIKPLNLNESDQAKTIDLIKEKKNLQQEIKKVNEPSLTEAQSERINEINNSLKDISKKAKAVETAKIKKLVQNLEEVSLNTMSTDEIQSYLEKSNLVENKEQAIKKSEEGAFIIQNPKTGKQEIIVNKDLGSIADPSHEALHAIIYKTVKSNPEAAVNLGKALQVELNKIDENLIKDSGIKNRLELYKSSPESVQMEEVLTLFSDAIRTENIKFNDTIFTKIGDFIRQVLQKAGVKASFNKSRDVFNFVKDYQKSVEKGKLTRGQVRAAKEGVKGSLIKETVKDTEVTIKESKANKELGNEIKALVPEGTTKRRYDSRIIGDVYAKLVQGNTLDGLINGQLNKFGVVGDNVYGKPKDIFLEDVKAQLYEKSLTRFNPETNDDLGGFVVNELIRYRIGDVVNKYKKEAGVSGKSLDVAAGEVGSVQEIADDTVSIEEQIDLADTETRSKTKLIKATKILSKEQYDKAAEIVKEKVKDIDPKNLSYKKISGFVTDIISKAIGVPAGKIIDAKKNLSKGETTAGAMFIENNIDYIRKTLPKGAVTEAATEKLMGTATGVPNSVLKLLYDKNPRIKKGAGLSPWTLKKGLTNQDILDAIGRPKRADDKRIQINPRSPEGQVIKGILSIVDKNIANELVRTVESDLTLEQKQDVAAGKSRLMFSKNSALEEGIDPKTLLSTKASKKTLSKAQVNEKSKLIFDDTKALFLNNIGDLNSFLDDTVDYLKNIKLKDKILQKNIRRIATASSTRGNLTEYYNWHKLDNNNSLKEALGIKKLIPKKWNSSNDIEAEYYDGTVEGIEVKMNWRDIMGSGGLFFDGEKVESYKYNNGEYKVSQDIVDEINNNPEIIKKLKTAIENASKVEAVVRDGNVSIPFTVSSKTDAEARSNRKALNRPKFDNVSMKVDQVVNHYTKKDVGLFIVGDELFYIQDKRGKFSKMGIPKLNTDASIKLRVKTSGIKNRKRTNDFVDSYTLTAQYQFDKKPEQGVKFSKVLAEDLDKTFNDILEKKSGIPSRKRYGIVEAITKGSSKGRFNFFIPPSAEDFVGLLYPTLGKGKIGDAQMSWYKKNLIDPYAEAMNKISKARVYMMNTYSSLKKQLDVVPKDLAKKIEGTDYTREQALRVYIWNKQKMNIPGISDADVSKLTSYIADDANLQLFGDQLINMQMGDGYVKPKEGWPAGTITTDILEGLNTTKRAKYLKKWQDNVDAIFSDENLNKLQAIYGLNYRKALENMLSRMKSGRNRSFSGDSLTGRFTDWLTGSVGTIMFLNTRSAVLQTISAINFVNFTDNNILAAGKAFANQKQYWTDFTELINSDFLKERRGGLRINVNEADIADMAKKGGVKGAISKLLELGFAPTQIADSFAIASGGATFYRNRINTYLKEKDANGNNVYTKKQAEKKAFEDFRETAEESQQSSRPDRISQQQASPLGRVILAFANTPAQYARIIKKAASDLKNNRGDAKENISKIIYYGAAQNLIFNALQQALFAFGFDEDEPEDKEKQKKYVNIANGMLDSLLRGGGIGGSIISVGKNAIIKIIKELEKDRPKLQNMVLEVSKISPPVSAKLSRLQQAARSYDWNKQEMKEKGLSLDNPAFLAGANVVSALTNIPLDRAIKKANNVVSATSQDLETWERLALLGGWSSWELGIKKEDKKEKKKPKSKIPVSKVKVRR
jgi:hypothetical protein